MNNFFSGKHVLITGAASGIGYDLLQILNSSNARVAGIDIQKIDTEVLQFQADVTKKEQMEKVRDELLAKWGRIDIIIAAAGVGGVNPGRCFSSELDQKIMSINYFGTVNTFMPFLEKMKEQGYGQLVGICSQAAFRGLPQGGSYSASKAAQMTLLESLRVDLKPLGIKVSCIHPGFVETPMTDHKEFDMPFMVSARKSSELILKAIKKGKSQYSYPWQLGLLSKLNRLLPNWLYDFIIVRASPPKVTEPKMLSALSFKKDE